MSADDTIAVALVEDDRSTREGLRLLIERARGFRCVGAFVSAEDALLRLAECPDVVLVDVQLPEMTGTELVPLLRERCPAVSILMLTAYDDDDKVFASICNGAHGYLLKKTPPSRLLEHIRDTNAGGSPISPEIARRMLSAFRQLAPRHTATGNLKPIEVRLLGLLADGHSYQSAGAALHISINTVRSYVRSIYETLQVHSKSEAVSKALRRGIL